MLHAPRYGHLPWFIHLPVCMPTNCLVPFALPHAPRYGLVREADYRYRGVAAASCPAPLLAGPSYDYPNLVTPQDAPKTVAYGGSSALALMQVRTTVCAHTCRRDLRQTAEAAVHKPCWCQ